MSTSTMDFTRETSRSSTPQSMDRLATLVNKDCTLPKRPWRLHTTPFADIVNHHYKGSGTKRDPYVVNWLHGDMEDPQLWSQTYKWTQVLLIAMLTFTVAFSSSAYAGGVKSIMAEFGGSHELITGGVTLFVLGFAFGPLLWAPASEVFGRRPVYIFTTLGLTLWQSVAIASPNMGALLVFRGLAGFMGSAPLTNGGGTTSDVLDVSQRTIGIALFCAAPFLGPSMGPIVGGYLNDAAGWRWIMALLAILSGVTLAAVILFAAETHAPTILRRRAATLSKVTGETYRYIGDLEEPMVPMEMFRTALTVPWKLLLDPIVLSLSIYIAVIYGTLYLNFAAYPIVFQIGRKWSAGQQGLAFLSTAVGTLLGVAVSVLKVTKENKKARESNEPPPTPTPEDRLPGAIAGGVFAVIGLAGFAATCGPNVHWMASIAFGVPFGFGLILTFLTVLGYLIDAYTIYTASVLASNTILRSMFGAAFPLFTPKMYAKLGIHWAAAVPGFLAFACLPFPILFIRYGAKVRAKSKWAAESSRQMAAMAEARAEISGHSGKQAL